MLSVFLFVLGFAEFALTENCGNCGSDADCVDCKSSAIAESLLKHDIFVGVGNLKYNCTATKCVLQVNTVIQSVKTECLQSDSTCCIPTGVVIDDTAQCQEKFCKLATGCDPRGFCTYMDATPVYDNCCRSTSHCPPTDPAPMLSPLDMACNVPTCTSNDCVYMHKTDCCIEKANCGANPTGSFDRICAPDPDFPGFKKCKLVLDQSESCANNDQCGGSLNTCFTGICNGNPGTCIISPRANPPTGCCAVGDLSHCVGNVCQVNTGCNSQVGAEFDGAIPLPDFMCIYENKFPRGCCINTPHCQTLSVSSSCIAPSCNTATNMCLLSPAQAGVPCCYWSDQCGIRNPADMCQFYTCNGPASTTVSQSSAFMCRTQTIADCTIPPVGGLVPIITHIAPTFLCSWTCGLPGSNTIITTTSFINPLAQNRPMYGFDYTLVVTNTAMQNVVFSVVLTDVDSSNPDRVIPAGLFVIQAPIVTLAAFSIKFAMQQFFTVDPGEKLTFKFETVFIGNALVTGLTFKSIVTPFEPCVAYYSGQTGCLPADALLLPPNQKKIYRAEQGSFLKTAGFANNPCNPQCLENAPTTSMGTATPVPTTTTIPVVTLPPGMSTGRDRIITLSVLDCSWICDLFDLTENRFKFEIEETSISPLAIFSAARYEIDLNLFDTSNHLLQLLAIGPAPPLQKPEIEPGLLSVTTSLVGNTFKINVVNPQLLLSQPLRFNVSFFLGIQSTNIVIGSGLARVTYFTPPQMCTLTLVTLGICTLGQVGTNIIIQDTVQVNLPFGSAPGECTQTGCPGRFGLARLIEMTIFPTDTWQCFPDSDVGSKNRHTFKVCFENTNSMASPNSPAMLIRGMDFTFASSRTFPNGSQADTRFTVPPYFLNDGTMTLTGDGVSTIIVPPKGSNSLWKGRFENFMTILIGENKCIELTFYRDAFFELRWPLVLDYVLLVRSPCSIVDIQTDFCATQGRLNTAADDPAVDSLVFGSIKSGVVSIGSQTYNAAPPLCLSGGLEPEIIGGRVFLDFDGDGTVDNLDVFQSGVIVEMVQISTQLVIGSTVTDVEGYFRFNSTHFSPPFTFVYFRIPQDGIPIGYILTIMGMVNPFFNNDFFDYPPRSPDTYLSSGDFFLAGFKPCQRSLDGPFPSGSDILIRLVKTVCTTCVTAPSARAQRELTLGCNPTLCTEAAVRQIVNFTYDISNFGLFEKPAAQISFDFSQALDNVDDSTLICADAVAFESSAGFHPLGESNDKSGTHVIYGFQSIPVGSSVFKFTVTVSYCASNMPFAYNATVTVNNDFCIDQIQKWSNCIPGIDYRQCFNEVRKNANICPGTCPPTSAPTPRPTPPTHAPTPKPGPAGKTTSIEAAIEYFMEGKMCVSKPLIKSQLCRDEDNALDVCKSTMNRGVISVNFDLHLKPSQIGEPGQAIVMLQRLMDRDTEFCGRFDPEITLVVHNGLTLVNNVAAVISSSVDQATQKMKLRLAFVAFDDQTTITLNARIIECLPVTPLTPLHYNASVQILTSNCFEESACTTVVELEDDTPVSVPCRGPVDDPAFADKNGPGTHITEHFEDLESDSSSSDNSDASQEGSEKSDDEKSNESSKATNTSFVIMCVIAGVAGCIMLVTCCFVCLPMFARRRLRGMSGVEVGGLVRRSAAPPKTIVFDASVEKRRSLYQNE